MMSTRILLLFAVATAYSVAPAWGVTVTNTNDAGAGSLRAAFSSGASVIDFAPLFSSPQTILLESPLPSVSHNLQVLGPGADLLTIDGQFRTNSDPLMGFYSPRPTILLEGFNLTGGYDPLSTGDVGGIFSRANLTLNSVAIRDNRGTGVFNQGGRLQIINSELSENTHEAVFVQSGSAVFTNSTVANNDQEGVFSQVGDVTFFNSTVANNGDAGVFNQQGTLRIRSSLLADNGSADMFSTNNSFSVTDSLVENAVGLVDGVGGNIIGFDAALGSLGFHGGPTRTVVPQTGSLAIDNGLNGLSLPTDQRGSPRTLGLGTDIGAVETIPEPSSAALGACLLAWLVASYKGPPVRG